MGYAKPEQTTAGIHLRLRARAFIFAKEAVVFAESDRSKTLNTIPICLQCNKREQRAAAWQRWMTKWDRSTGGSLRTKQVEDPIYLLDANQTVCFVSIDAGMGSDLLNIRLLERLKILMPPEAQSLCTMETLSISGTHTHSAPGGFIQYALYQLSGTGFVEETMSALVEGTAQSILRAYQNLRPGKLHLSEGLLFDANINRSPTSYILNPEEERKEYSQQGDTDKTMLQIFAESDDGTPMGLLNWFAVHGTSMNGTNHLISGDNKGYASYLMEKRYNGNDTLPGKGSFIAAFASTNLGDVSPNIAGPRCIDTGLPCDMVTSTCNGQMHLCVALGPGRDMYESTEIIGRRQYNKALELMQHKNVVQGPVRSRHSFVQLSHRNVTLSNGTIVHTCPAALGLSFGGGTTDGSGGLNFHQGMNGSYPFWSMVFGHLSLPTRAQKACHAPKPIMLNTGNVKLPYDWDPITVPLSIFQVGTLFILNVPSEFTTMAGRRLRKAVQELLLDAGFEKPAVTIAGLANSYTHYVTTFEEYQAQRYEAASTLYGPYTLDAYIQEFRRITDDLIHGRPSDSDDSPRDLSKRQISILAPVEYDAIAPGRTFGETVQDAKDTYNADGNETVEVVFRSSNPRNNQRIEDTFLTVDRLGDHGVWKTVYTDGDWCTRYFWKGGTAASFGMSYAEIHWNIASDTTRGLYRICHYGTRQTLWGDAKAWAYYAPDWMNPIGSYGVKLLGHALRLAVALSSQMRSFAGLEGDYSLQEYMGCSKTFLVHDP